MGMAKGAVKLLTLTSIFLQERGNHGNFLYVILLSILSTVLLYKPFRVTGALQAHSLEKE